MMDERFIDSCQRDAQWEATLAASGFGTVCKRSCVCPRLQLRLESISHYVVTISGKCGTHLKIASEEIHTPVQGMIIRKVQDSVQEFRASAKCLIIAKFVILIHRNFRQF
jgi:hypothetical protein